eukprot:6356926-Amphidinium_carterae.1
MGSPANYENVELLHNEAILGSRDEDLEDGQEWNVDHNGAHAETASIDQNFEPAVLETAEVVGCAACSSTYVPLPMHGDADRLSEQLLKASAKGLSEL